MGLSNPGLAYGAITAWRKGYWDKVLGKTMSREYRENSPLWYYYHLGYKAATDYPNEIGAFCYSQADLIDRAVQAAVQYASKADRSKMDQRTVNTLDVLLEAWQRLLLEKPWAPNRKHPDLTNTRTKKAAKKKKRSRG